MLLGIRIIHLGKHTVILPRSAEMWAPSIITCLLMPKAEAGAWVASLTRQMSSLVGWISETMLSITLVSAVRSRMRSIRYSHHVSPTGGRVTDGSQRQVNFVGNTYKKGPASKLEYALKADYEDNFAGVLTYYCSGNQMPGVFDQDSVQYVGQGTEVTTKIACWAKESFEPVPTYKRFYDQP